MNIETPTYGVINLAIRNDDDDLSSMPRSDLLAWIQAQTARNATELSLGINIWVNFWISGFLDFWPVLATKCPPTAIQFLDWTCLPTYHSHYLLYSSASLSHQSQLHVERFAYYGCIHK